MKHPDQRVGVFIDVQNMYYSAKNLHGKKVNFGNIVQEAVAGRKLIRAIAYVVRTETKEEQPFFEALYNMGIETREKDLQIFHSGMKKADWDVGLTVDAIRLAPTLDAFVLVSGDGDYQPLLEYLQSALGKQAEVAAFAETTSSKLIDQADVHDAECVLQKFCHLRGPRRTYLHDLVYQFPVKLRRKASAGRRNAADDLRDILRFVFGICGVNTLRRKTKKKILADLKTPFLKAR